MFTVDTADFLIVVAIAAVAATAVTFGGKRVFVPVVVLELVLGIVIGPDVLGIAERDSFIDFFANLGLGMLFFFAGYEIDFERIRGEPLKLAADRLGHLAGSRLLDRRAARRWPASCSRCSSRARRWRRPRSAR